MRIYVLEGVGRGAVALGIIATSLATPSFANAINQLQAGQASQPAPAIEPVYAGDCLVRVSKGNLRTGDRLLVELDGGRLKTVTIDAATKSAVEFPTVAPVETGETARLRVNGDLASATAVVRAATDRPADRKPTGSCAAEKEEGYEGPSFEATAYFGWAYDQFAPAQIAGYPPGTATAAHNRLLFGVDFDYRAIGNDGSKVRLWIAGETLHGVRSADVDCAAETNKPAVCNPQPGLEYARAVLANATSLEAYVAPRLDLLRLQKNASTAARLYATARFGFIAIEGAPRVYDNFHVGLGLRADNSAFEGSTVEVGWGNNELLSGRDWKRLKIDALLSVSLDKIPGLRDKGRFFIEMFIDNDLRGPSPDSIQTFVGFDLDIRRFLGGS